MVNNSLKISPTFYLSIEADQALKIVMRQAEKMCGNMVVEWFWYDKVAEEKGKYRVT